MFAFYLSVQESIIIQFNCVVPYMRKDARQKEIYL